MRLLTCAPLLAGLISGCGHTPYRTLPDARAAEIERHLALARQLYEAQEYHASLIQWRILRTFDPENREIRSEFTRLQDMIREKARKHLARGKNALKNSRPASAKREFLKALALDPTHRDALGYLRRIEETHIKAIQTAKLETLRRRLIAQAEEQEAPEAVSKAALTTIKPDDEPKTQDYYYLELGIKHFENGEMEAGISEFKKYLANNPADRRARRYIMEASLNLARQQEEKGNLEDALNYLEDAVKNTPSPDNAQIADYANNLKTRLADDYYNKGLKVFRRDLNKAIAYWEKAVRVNPNHINAQLRLKNAYRIKKNLKGIEDSD